MGDQTVGRLRRFLLDAVSRLQPSSHHNVDRILSKVKSKGKESSVLTLKKLRSDVSRYMSNAYADVRTAELIITKHFERQCHGLQ